MRVAVIGCGLMGRRRAAIAKAYGDAVTAVADVDQAAAERLAREADCQAATDWRRAVETDADIVVVSTPTKHAMPISVAALERGKHVLCEKPMGRNLAEAGHMVAAAQAAGKVLKVGFNLRYHGAVREAKAACAAGRIGKLMYARCVYGHGGRPGYEKEWRADPDISGGGELMDQGTHLLDLLRWFMGDFARAYGITTKAFWPMPVEDNSFALLETANGCVANLQASWTQWKNTFVFEVFGTDGFVRVEGLGGSYGPERLVLARRRPESGPPIEEVREFNGGAEGSLEAEWRDFRSALDGGRRPLSDAQDSVEVMRLVDAIYRATGLGQSVAIRP